MFDITPFQSKPVKFRRLEFASLCTALYASELEDFIRKVESAYTEKTIQNMTSTLTKVEKEHRLFNQTEVLSTKVKELETNRDNERNLQTQELSTLRNTTHDEFERLERQLIEIKYSMLPFPFMKSLTDTTSKRIIMDKLMMRSGANIVDLERNIKTYKNVTIMVVSIARFSELVTRFDHNPHYVLELLNRFYSTIETIANGFNDMYCIDRVCSMILNDQRLLSNAYLYVEHQ